MHRNKHRRSVHSLYVKILCNELTQEGIGIEESLRAAHLPLNFMASGEGMVSVFEFQHLIDFARVRTGKHWLGLTLGAKVVSNHHGPLGYLMTSSPNFSSAIDGLLKFVSLRTHLLKLSLAIGAREARLTLQEVDNIEPIRVVFLEAFMIVTLAVLRLVFGRAIPGLRLEFAYQTPSYANLYNDYFECPVQFSCKTNAILFDADALPAQNIMADAKAFRLAEIECQNLLTRRLSHQSLKSKIEEIVLNPNTFFPTLDVVAERMCMSKSTLIRNLAKENTSYKQLIDNLRHELASYYLIETTITMEQIAEKLGYQDASNFSRTFQRWTNLTPSNFRASYNLLSAAQRSRSS